MPEQGRAEREPAPWRDHRFLVFAAGNFVNNLGEGAYKIALPLYVYEVTGSLAVMSVLAALSPATLLLSPWLGAVVDRWGPRVFVVPGLLVQLAGGVALSLNVLVGRPSTAALFVLAAVVQLGGEMYRAGWMAGVPSMFPRSPGRSRAVLSSLFVASNIIGPLLVVVLLGPFGYVGLLWFNTTTFLAPIAVWLVGIHPPSRQRPASGGFLLGGRDILDGWRVITAEKRVLYVKLTALPLHFASGIGVLAFMIWYLRDQVHLGASGVGAVQAVANVGALAGSMMIAALASVRTRMVLAASAVGMTGALFAMALPVAAVFVVCMVVFFSLRSAMTATSEMIIVKYLPVGVVGRAAGVFNLIDGVPILVAPLLILLVQRTFGATAVLVFLGVVAAGSMSLLAMFWHRWNGHGAGQERRLTQQIASPADPATSIGPAVGVHRSAR
jgi:MFS family permease